VIYRASKLFLPTLREDPADAESPSHRLLLRAGLVRQVGAGLYAFLMPGWRAHQRIVQIIREEMDAIGAQEILMPLLTPADLWRRSGRYDALEVFKVHGRGDREYVLALSHEETLTFLAREIRSYKELPQSWYHFGLKERDEPRPRAGLLRVREFIMKDSYSLDRDEEGLDASYWKHAEAYRRIFDRCELRYYEVEGDVGLMGGSGAHEYLAPCEAGENAVALCSNGDYAANVEVARSQPTRPDFDGRRAAPEEVETPGVTTIDGLAELLGIDAAATSKAMPVVKTDGTLVLALIRGDDRLEEAKLAAALTSDSRPATEDEIRQGFGADPGSIGPVGFSGEIVVDEALREGQFVAGANRTGRHLRGVEHGRDFTGRFADLRQPREGDTCPVCGGRLGFQTAIEVGHIFKFGARYSQPLGATFLDDDGKEKPLVGGSYGIGPARVMAAVVEQRHLEEKGIRWPASIAPYDVHVVALPGLEEQAERAAQEFDSGGRTVLLDDRELRAGEKFADADLIGSPVRVVVGKKTLEDGAVDVRSNGGEQRVAIDELAGVS
jgi:prolyl-tRNA synthetase